MKYQGLVAWTFVLSACGSSQATNDSQQVNAAAAKSTVTLELTDAPKDDIKSVYVNVDHAELRMRRGTTDGWVVVAENLGAVNLLDLRDGVTLPMASVTVPAGTEVTQIRLVLAATDNYIIKMDGTRCDMKTPSEQMSGIKLLIHQGIQVEGGFNYTIVADFDADKSVVLTGNDGCLLKPVIKLKSASRSSQAENPPPTEPPAGEPPVGQPPAEQPPVEPLPVTGDNGVDEGTGGFEVPVETPPAPVIDPSML